jgi:hypothetical protein
MGSQSGFGALSFLLDGGSSVACGTWFFVDGQLLPARLKEKTRSVVATRDSDDGGVVVYPRSASREVGVVHTPHTGHPCEARASHDTLRATYNAHPCHIDKQGWVDFDTPITLTLDDIDGCRMCFEDETSRLLHLLEEGLP